MGHRYWRVANIETYGGGDLEIAEFHLLSAGTRVDIPASLSATVGPITGVLSNLQDGDIDTKAAWSRSTLPNLKLVWDFGGSAPDVDDIRIGSGGHQEKFILFVKLQFSDDAATWNDLTTIPGASWPGVRTLTVSDEGVYDPHRNSVTSMLPFDGANNSTTIVDTVTARPLQWVANGNAKLSTAQSKVGTSSLYLNGADSYLQGSSTPPQWVLGTDDFTIEGFFRTDSITTFQNILSTGAYNSAQLTIRLSNTGLLQMYTGNGSSPGIFIGGTAPVSPNTWYHFAVNRTSGVTTLYLDGVVQSSSATVFSILNTAGAPRIGYGTGDSLFFFSGYLDAVRVVRGVGRYPSAFTPPTNTVSGGIRLNLLRSRVAPISVSLVASDGAAYAYSGMRLTPYLRARYDYNLRGSGRVSGTVKEIGTPEVPVRRKVRLIREVDGLLVREQWSNAITGVYDFQDVELGFKYTVLSYDHLGNYRAVVADRLEPELMP